MCCRQYCSGKLNCNLELLRDNEYLSVLKMHIALIVASILPIGGSI